MGEKEKALAILVAKNHMLTMDMMTEPAMEEQMVGMT